MATTTVIGNVVTAVTNNIAKIKTAIGNATTSAAGLMTTAQVTKLNGIATGATKNTIDSALSTTSTNAVQNKVVTANINTLKSGISDEQTARESADSTLAGRATSLETAVDTLNGTGDGSVSKAVSDGIAGIGNATTSAAGLMTTAQVTKLNGIATGATKNTIDSALSTTSTNAVQNKVVTAKINTLSGNIATRLATQSLTASGGTLTFTDSSITTTSLIDVYATIPNIAPSDISASAGTCTVTFDAQDSAFDVCITVRN